MLDKIIMLLALESRIFAIFKLFSPAHHGALGDYQGKKQKDTFILEELYFFYPSCKIIWKYNKTDTRLIN